MFSLTQCFKLVVLNIDLHAPIFRSSLLGNAAGVK